MFQWNYRLVTVIFENKQCTPDFLLWVISFILITIETKFHKKNGFKIWRNDSNGSSAKNYLFWYLNRNSVQTWVIGRKTSCEAGLGYLQYFGSCIHLLTSIFVKYLTSSLSPCDSPLSTLNRLPDVSFPSASAWDSCNQEKKTMSSWG